MLEINPGLEAKTILTRNMNIFGTAAYMSPEQREGKDIDGRSDLYACGIVLFEILTGTRPAGGERN